MLRNPFTLTFPPFVPPPINSPPPFLSINFPIMCFYPSLLPFLLPLSIYRVAEIAGMKFYRVKRTDQGCQVVQEFNANAGYRVQADVLFGVPEPEPDPSTNLDDAKFEIEGDNQFSVNEIREQYKNVVAALRAMVELSQSETQNKVPDN
ncbi:hypothetical protein HHK36_011050 [Tetracentron sinense]|uniref:Uncharacterized protein n=1 Tax=Tetracentron sinense TaxID=13715 RepID=A0A834ZAK8_TETSI|nr:hypothetical protein HHK36_011050 [Tetracentron sinense]